MLAAAACALSVVAASCSTGGKNPFSEVPQEALNPGTAPTSTTVPTVASPLTGAAVSPAVASRPAVIVKVDNSPNARPQRGLNDADVIYEERVEGSVVRFLAVFQSKDEELVGPVRSLRTTDAAIVAPIGGVFAFSGGIAAVVRRVASTGITMTPESDDPKVGVYKRAGKLRPFATYADTTKLRARAKPTPPPPLFARFYTPSSSFALANPSASPILGARVVFGQLTTADWMWDRAKQSWLRSTNGTLHNLEDGSRLSTSCLVLQTVPYRSTQYTDRTNFTVDEAVITGSGRAIVACDGHALAARWQKPSLKSVTTYTDAVTGAPITLPVGRVWVSLVPTNGVITLKSPPVTTTTMSSR